jgi:hypothetical protein
MSKPVGHVTGRASSLVCDAKEAESSRTCWLLMSHSIEKSLLSVLQYGRRIPWKKKTKTM